MLFNFSWKLFQTKCGMWRQFVCIVSDTEGVKHIHPRPMLEGPNIQARICFLPHLLIDANMDDDIVLRKKPTEHYFRQIQFYFSTSARRHFCAQAAKAQAIDFATNPDVLL